MEGGGIPSGVEEESSQIDTVFVHKACLSFASCKFILIRDASVRRVVLLSHFSAAVSLAKELFEVTEPLLAVL